MYDAIVVGARCAGSTTAMLLARRGYRVLLVDKAGFPSDTLSTHYIHQPGVASLQRFGVLDRVAASGCPPVRRQVFDVGPFALYGTPPAYKGADVGYGPRRKVLDAILLDAAVDAGAEVRDRFAVQDLLTEDGRVTGIRGRTQAGTPVTEEARCVIGADGMRSLVARLVGAETYDERPTTSGACYTYYADVPVETAELHVRPGRMIIAAPTNDDLTLAIVYWPIEEMGALAHNLERRFDAALDLAPELAERVREGRRVESFHGSSDLPGFFRRPYGPGWALVGDAGYHKNPITAEGITDAFRDAELLTEALDDFFSGRRPELAALARYEQRRNEAAKPLYDLTAELARLEPPGNEMVTLFSALRGNEEDSGRFLGTIAGTVAIDEFFAPANLERIIGASPRW